MELLSSTSSLPFNLDATVEAPLLSSCTMADDPPQERSSSPLQERATDSSSSSYLLSSIKNFLDNDLRFEIRRQQHHDLRQAYCRWSCNNKRSPELVLLSGPSGSGKTHLVTFTLDNVVLSNDSAILIQGKFDFLQRSEPYQAFVSALTEFTDKILTGENLSDTDRSLHDKEKLTATAKSAILEAVGEGAGRLTSMIPALEPLLGHQHYDNSVALREGGISSFAYIFRRFVRSICSCERPVVFLLKNLQWADPSSLDLLLSLLTDNDCHGALFIGTCCDMTLQDVRSQVSLRLETLTRERVPVTIIQICNLSEDEVANMTAKVLQLPKEHCLTLAHMIYLQTGGCLFYLIEFVRWLEEKALLQFDTTEGRWHWETEEIAFSIGPNRVGGFMIDKIKQQSPNVEEVLKASSCLGVLDPELLQMTVEVDVMSSLQAAVDHGLLVVVDRSSRAFQFAHDLVVKVAYALLQPENRRAFHLMIGRKILLGLNEQRDEQKLDKYVYILASQFILSGKLIQDRGEKDIVAALCLHAGRKAARSSTFQIASAYLNFGIELLGPTCWRDHYVQSLELYNAAAEMALCTADFQVMEELLSTIFSNVRNAQDRLQPYATRIYSFAVRDQQQHAIELGIAVLKELGETFPSRLLQIPITLRDLGKIRCALCRKSDAMLLRMPVMEDLTKVAAIRILNMVLLSSLIWRPAFAIPVIMRMVELTLRYGISPWTATAFAAYATLCSIMGRVDEGYRFSQLALTVLESSGRREFLPRVYALVYGCTYSWTRPMLDTVEPLRHAHRIGLETGDFEFAFTIANLLFINSFHAGVPLPHLEKALKTCCDMMETRKQQQLLRRMCMIGLQTVHHLMGFTDDPLLSPGDVVDLATALDDLPETNNQMAGASLDLRRIFIAYVFGDCDLVVDIVKERLGRVYRFPQSALVMSGCILHGLVAAMMARRRPKERTKCLRILSRQIRRFKKWAYDSPQNCLDKLFLLRAESASVMGKHKVAVTHYINANALAADSGCLWLQAIANERAAEHLAQHGDAFAARAFFLRACEVWEQWGASAKVRRLRMERSLSSPIDQ